MPSVAESLEKLREMREHHDRKSREIIELWTDNVALNLSKLGKERPLVLEQVCIAALDTYQFNVALKCIQELYKDFPKSLRVKRYEAMYYEAQEHYEEAVQLLDNIIKVDETNSGARKRKIAILKAQGRLTEAIKELTEYLKIFMADTEAWQELSELYISEQDYNKAAFCVEELILHNPHNHLLHQRYADIKYTQGGLDNIEIARSYYSQALKLNAKNVRALYGLYLTSTAISGSQKCAAQKKKDAAKLTDWALAQLATIYNHTEDVESKLGALQIN